MAHVEIYTWSTCPFCHRAKKLLDQKGVTYTEYTIDDDDTARDTMVARGTNGQHTVPQIFIDNRHREHISFASLCICPHPPTLSPKFGRRGVEASSPSPKVGRGI